MLEGDFTFEKDSEGNVSGSIKDGKLKMKSGGKDLISLTEINGSFEMSGEGIYGALRVEADPGFDNKVKLAGSALSRKRQSGSW